MAQNPPYDETTLPDGVGGFEYYYDTGKWTWSDAVARMHGYEPGEVEPTTELVLSHKHPDDLAVVRDLLHRSASPFSSRHRIVTTTGEVRKVVVVGEAVTDAAGRNVATRGYYVDITTGINAELQHDVGERLGVVVANRANIEQAKGILMAVYSLDADAAFELLKWRSQDLNVKVSTIAKRLIDDVPNLLKVQPADRAHVDDYLMTLGMPAA
jgi:hypothetical protein